MTANESRHFVSRASPPPFFFFLQTGVLEIIEVGGATLRKTTADRRIQKQKICSCGQNEHPTELWFTITSDVPLKNKWMNNRQHFNYDEGVYVLLFFGLLEFFWE